MKSPPRRWAILAALFGVLSGVGAAAEAGTTIRVQLEDLAVWKTRLEWSSQDAVLLYTERREPGSTAATGAAALLPAEWALSFGSRRLVCGTVCPTGLIRQLANPLGFLPEADVYREPAGLEPDRGIDPGSRRGGQLRLAEGRLRLLVFQEQGQFAEGSAHAGVSLCLPVPAEGPVRVEGPARAGGPPRAEGPGTMELLALLGEPPATAGFEQWYPGQVPFPGGLLSHGAAQLRAGTAALDLRLSGAVSGGERVPPGIWGTVGSTLWGGRWEARLLAGACGRDYRAPCGEAVPERGLAAAALRVRATPGATLELRASRLLSAASEQVPVLTGWREWKSTDRVRFRVEARRLPEAGGQDAAPARRRFLGPGDELLLEASGAREAGAQGLQGLSGEGRVSFRRTRRSGPSGGSTVLSAELSAGLSTDQPGQTRVGLRWRRRGQTSIGLEAEARLEAGGELGLQGSLVLWRPGARLYCRFGALGLLGAPGGSWADGLSLVLGWEARAPREGAGAYSARTVISPSSRP